jgi:6,7-dimethyl-8-ribityllumazine synthase
MRAKPAVPQRDSRVAQARVAIIRAEYNAGITGSLESKCVATLAAGGISIERIERFTVPGCFEIPIMAQRLAQRKQFDVMIALGAVIKGDTYHFELVANECARGIMNVSLKYDVPIVFEVLAVYRKRDALRRAGNNRMNKGIEAAGTALALLRQFTK